jgi:hypothetical protein
MLYGLASLSILYYSVAAFHETDVPHALELLMVGIASAGFIVCCTILARPRRGTGYRRLG